MAAYKLNLYRRSRDLGEEFAGTFAFDAEDDQAARVHIDQAFKDQIAAADRAVLVGAGDAIVWEKDPHQP